MKNSLRNMLLIVLSLFMVVIAVPISIANASTKDNYLSSFSVSKKTIFKGNGVSISLDSAKKSSGGLEITFIIKNGSKNNYSISAHEYAINNLMAGGTTYGSDVDVALEAGYDVRHGLIGSGVYASHGYERSHKDGVCNTLRLLVAYCK